MMAAGGLVALPVAVSWPIHRALIWLHDEVEQRGQVLPFAVRVRSDPDAYIAVEGAEEALAALIAEGFLVLSGSGYTARWAVEAGGVTAARRALLREDPATGALVVHAGQRLATWASTALKNVDTASASWSATVCGPIPTVRQPPLVALR